MEYKLLYKRKLPHFQPREGIFFITFRINFPIPEKYLAAYQRYKTELELSYKDKAEESETKTIIKKKLFASIDEIYPQCTTDFSLTENAEVAAIIRDRILALQNLYHLYTFTLMPNHVHLLLKPGLRDGIPVQVSELVQLIKGWTAREANQLIYRKGSFWFREYFDYWVRNQDELFNVFEYIRQNPVKAGLVEKAEQWQWTWVNPEYIG